VARWLRALILTALLALPLAIAASRDTPQRDQSMMQQTIELTGEPFAPTITPFGTPFIPATQPFFDPEATPEPTPFPTATPVIPADVQLLLQAREDLERLADDQIGPGQRPEGWNGPVPFSDTQIALITRLDLEVLASTLINPSQRPANWFGTVGSTPFAVARDVRHDLEVLADLRLGRTQRPVGWIGGDPLFACNRATQTLISLLERGGVFRLEVPANDPEFCRKAEIEVTRFTEMNILANAQIGELFRSELTLLSPHNINSRVAVAFLNRAATQRLGVVPNGTPIQVVARSYAEFSNMMLIAGDGFQVFVDYNDTTVTPRQFRALPNVDSLEAQTYCFVEWCSRTGQ
jgi:hypothetical protein